MSSGALKPIARISPSMAARLQRCALEAIYSSNTSTGLPAISGPAARIGTACHRVLEAIANGDIPATANWETAFQDLWASILRVQEHEALNSPYERHVGPAGRWRNVGIQRARLKRLAYQLWNAQQEYDVTPSAERRYEAFHGHLVGIADVVRETPAGIVIEDYKTGTIRDVDEETGTTTIRASYRQQMLLYAAMHHDVHGVWPIRGRLIPLEGDPVDVPIAPDEASQLVSDILQRAEKANTLLTQGIPLEQIGQPSPDTCRYCVYQAPCPAFWAAVDHTWAWEIHAIEGDILRTDSRADGTVVATIQAVGGSLLPSTIIVLAKAGFVADQLTTLRSQRARITHIRMQQGGGCATTERSAIMRCAEP